jgi:hypothetical protein
MNVVLRLAALSVLALVPTLHAATSASLTTTDTSKRPNVIFIMADDQRFDELGCTGQEPEWFRKERGIHKHGQSMELFNLADDPQQLANQFSNKPAVADNLKKLLDRYVSSGRSRP